MADAPENALDSAAEPAPAVWKPALKEAAWAFLAAAVLLIIVYALAFKHIHPEFERFLGQGAKPLTATGKDFIPVSVGKGRKAGTQYIIEDFSSDEAILALPRRFRAEDYPFIKVNLSGFTRYSKAKILWQQAGDPTTHALEFNRSGDEVTQIAMVYGGEAYKGPIDSIALLFYDGPALGFENNNEVDIVVESIEFRPFSAGRVAEQIFEDWMNPPLWQGYSNNIVIGVHKNYMLQPNAALTALTITGILIALGYRWFQKWLGKDQPAPPIVAMSLLICAYGWGVNESLRWQWRVQIIDDIYARYYNKPLDERVYNSPLRCGRDANNCHNELLPHF